MTTGFAKLPHSPRFVVANARIPGVLLNELPSSPNADGLVAADIVVNNGMVERLAPAGSQMDFPHVDLDDGMVWPTFVDMHAHIDKGHISPRRPNPDGTFGKALEAVLADQTTRWTAADVSRRMDFCLRAAYAHGTSLMRTHIDSLPPQDGISWPVFADMREKWAGRIELQGAALVPIDLFLDDQAAAGIVSVVAEHGGVLGAFILPIPQLDKALDAMIGRAADHGLALDFHVDETADPENSLLQIAEAAIRNGFQGPVVAGHCCSLAVQPAAQAEATMERVAEAGIAVVSLPMCNMYLQDRQAGRTPRWRGVTLLHELAARDVPLAVASDNTRDPFYPYGDLDMVEVFRQAVCILQLDHPIAEWARLVASAPAAIIGRADAGRIAVGHAADLVLFKARSWTELLARPQSDRTVLRAGKAIDRTLPDYRELDDLMGRS